MIDTLGNSNLAYLYIATAAYNVISESFPALYCIVWACTRKVLFGVPTTLLWFQT